MKNQICQLFTCGGISESGGKLLAVPDRELLVLADGLDRQEVDVLSILDNWKPLYICTPVLPRSLDPFHEVTNYIKRFKSSWI